MVLSRQEFLEQCNSGDILLFKGTEWYSRLIEWYCGSNISHVGIIIIDPTIHGKMTHGIFVLESELYESGKSGVRLTPIQHLFDMIDNGLYSSMYIRFLHRIRDSKFRMKIDAVCDATLNKKYDDDPIDWFKAMYDLKLGNEQKTNRFWCSALAAYTYINLGFLDANIPWTIIKPSEFSFKCIKSILNFKCVLSSDIEIDKQKQLVVYSSIE